MAEARDSDKIVESDSTGVKNIMKNRVEFLLFPACAMSLGWAFRGFIGGGPLGAMIPGAMVTLALAWLLGREEPSARNGMVAAFGAVGIGLGGQMTYGQTVGLASDFATMPWGLLGLALKGAIWGLSGGAVLGLAFTMRRYSRAQVIVALAAMLAATWAGWRWANLPKLIYFSNRLDRPREEMWAGLLLGTVAMLAVLLAMRWNAVLLRFALASFVGGGLGFGLGGALLAAGRNSTLNAEFWPWWKGMEYTFGLLFGLALGWAAGRSRAELAGDREASESDGEASANSLSGMPLMLASIVLVGAAACFEYAGTLRFGYSVAGVVLLIVALYSEALAWHIAMTLTCFSFLMDLAEAYYGDLEIGPAWIGLALAMAGALAFWKVVESLRVAERDVLPKMFLLMTLTAFAVTTISSAMRAWYGHPSYVEYAMFVVATFIVWRIYAWLRAGERVDMASSV